MIGGDRYSGYRGIHYSKVALSGLHEWDIECEKMNLNDKIGITASLDNIGTCAVYELTQTTYFWWAHDGVWKNGDCYKEGWNSKNNELFGKWDSGDTITVTLDTEKKTLTFKGNGKMFWEPLELPQDEEYKWYPFLVTSYYSSKYTHIV